LSDEDYEASNSSTHNTIDRSANTHGRDVKVLTYTAPSKKIAQTANFLLIDICNFDVQYIGIIRIRISVITSEIVKAWNMGVLW